MLQLLFYPGCAGHQNTPSHETFAKGFLLEEPHISYFFHHYLRGPEDRNDWRFARWMASTNTAGLPIWTGGAGLDRPGRVRPAHRRRHHVRDRLRMAGVPVELEIYAGVVHGFIQFGRAIPQALQSHADAARALRHALG
jgi:acetyl esterase